MKKHNRRSSILKPIRSPNRQASEDDANTQNIDDVTVGLKKPKRRVSFANTCQIKEFTKETHLAEFFDQHQGSHDSDSSPDITDLLTGVIKEKTSSAITANQKPMIESTTADLNPSQDYKSSSLSAIDRKTVPANSCSISQSNLQFPDRHFVDNVEKTPVSNYETFIHTSINRVKNYGPVYYSSASNDTTSIVSSFENNGLESDDNMEFTVSHDFKIRPGETTLYKWANESTKVFEQSEMDANSEKENVGLDKTLHFNSENNDDNMDFTVCHTSMFSTSSFTSECGNGKIDQNSFLKRLKSKNSGSSVDIFQFPPENNSLCIISPIKSNNHGKLDTKSFLRKRLCGNLQKIDDKMQSRFEVFPNDSGSKIENQIVDTVTSHADNHISVCNYTSSEFIESKFNTANSNHSQLFCQRKGLQDITHVFSNENTANLMELTCTEDPSKDLNHINSTNEVSSIESHADNKYKEVSIHCKSIEDSKLNSKTFLQDEDERTIQFCNNADDMEFTTCISDENLQNAKNCVQAVSYDGEKTTIYGGTSNDMEFTTCLTDVSSQNKQNLQVSWTCDNKERDGTWVDGRSNDREFVTCYRSVNLQQTGNVNRNCTSSRQPNEKTVLFDDKCDMELTACIPNVNLQRQNTSNDINNTLFGGKCDDMEFTACVSNANLLNKENLPSCCIRYDKESEKTTLFDTKSDDMEFTSCIPNINLQNKENCTSSCTNNPTETDKTLCEAKSKNIEFTTCISNDNIQNKENLPCSNTISDKEIDKTTIFDAKSDDMEFTACISTMNLQNKEPFHSNLEHEQGSEKTTLADKTCDDMEFTSCISKVNLNNIKEKSTMGCTNESRESEKTTLFDIKSDGMDFTACIAVNLQNKENLNSGAFHKDGAFHKEIEKTKSDDMKFTSCLTSQTDMIKFVKNDNSRDVSVVCSDVHTNVDNLAIDKDMANKSQAIQTANINSDEHLSANECNNVKGFLKNHDVINSSDMEFTGCISSASDEIENNLSDCAESDNMEGAGKEYIEEKSQAMEFTCITLQSPFVDDNQSNTQTSSHFKISLSDSDVAKADQNKVENVRNTDCENHTRNNSGMDPTRPDFSVTTKKIEEDNLDTHSIVHNGSASNMNDKATDDSVNVKDHIESKETSEHSCHSDQEQSDNYDDEMKLKNVHRIRKDEFNAFTEKSVSDYQNLSNTIENDESKPQNYQPMSRLSILKAKLTNIVPGDCLSVEDSNLSLKSETNTTLCSNALNNNSSTSVLNEMKRTSDSVDENELPIKKHCPSLESASSGDLICDASIELVYASLLSNDDVDHRENCYKNSSNDTDIVCTGVNDNLACKPDNYCNKNHQSMSILSNKSLMCNSSISHLSVLQDIQQKLSTTTKKSIDDYLDAFDMQLGSVNEIHRSTIAPTSVNSLDTIGEHMLLRIQDCEHQVHSSSVNEMSRMIEHYKSIGDTLEDELLADLPKMLEEPDSENAHEKLHAIKSACLFKSKRLFKEWREKNVQSIINAMKDDEVNVQKGMEQLTSSVNELRACLLKIYDDNKHLKCTEHEFDTKVHAEEKNLLEEINAAKDAISKIECKKVELELQCKNKVADIEKTESTMFMNKKFPNEDEVIKDLKLKIQCLQKFIGFTLRKWSREEAVFNFMGIAELNVQFGDQCLQNSVLPVYNITDITWKSVLQNSANELQNFAGTYILKRIDSNELKKRCHRSDNLHVIIPDIQTTVHETVKLCKDIEHLRLWHSIKLDAKTLTLHVTFAHLKSVNKFVTSFSISPFSSSWNFKKCFGSIQESQIAKVFNSYCSNGIVHPSYLCNVIGGISRCLERR